MGAVLKFYPAIRGSSCFHEIDLSNNSGNVHFHFTGGFPDPRQLIFHLNPVEAIISKASLRLAPVAWASCPCEKIQQDMGRKPARQRIVNRERRMFGAGAQPGGEGSCSVEQPQVAPEGETSGSERFNNPKRSEALPMPRDGFYAATRELLCRLTQQKKA